MFTKMYIPEVLNLHLIMFTIQNASKPQNYEHQNGHPSCEKLTKIKLCLRLPINTLFLL